MNKTVFPRTDSYHDHVPTGLSSRVRVYIGYLVCKGGVAVEFIIIPEVMDDRISRMASFDELEAADDLKETCCGG